MYLHIGVSLLLSLYCISGMPSIYPDAAGSLHQLPIKCDKGQEFKYVGTDTDGDGIKVKYSCGGSAMSKQLTCTSGFKAYSKRDAIACDPTNAIFRDASTDANNIDSAVVVWYCMKKDGSSSCTS